MAVTNAVGFEPVDCCQCPSPPIVDVKTARRRVSSDHTAPGGGIYLGRGGHRLDGALVNEYRRRRPGAPVERA